MDKPRVIIEDGVPKLADTAVTIRQVVDLWRSGVDIADLPEQLAITPPQAATALKYYGEKMAELED